MKTIAIAWLAGALVAAGGAALAQTAEPAPEPAAVTGSAAQVESRLVGAYAPLAGSEANARSLVTGLRQGGEITLTAAGAGGQAGESVTFSAPTRPMGYGNVRLTLALAQESLAQHGITQPTPSQLQAALTGGTIATGTGEPGATAQLAGVLQLRADGMGWGQIANSLGVKLGPVVSGKTAQPAPSAAAAGSASGITTAGGASAAVVRGGGRGAGPGPLPPQRAGAGIVTATGGASAAGGAGLRYGSGGGRPGVVTGAGATAGSSASAAGLAHGRAHARP